MKTTLILFCIIVAATLVSAALDDRKALSQRYVNKVQLKCCSRGWTCCTKTAEVEAVNTQLRQGKALSQTYVNRVQLKCCSNGWTCCTKTAEVEAVNTQLRQGKALSQTYVNRIQLKCCSNGWTCCTKTAEVEAVNTQLRQESETDFADTADAVEETVRCCIRGTKACCDKLQNFVVVLPGIVN